MKKPVSNLPASVRDRLRNLARNQGRTLNEVLQYYAIERFLYRLSQSPHAHKFILKGGLVFFAWGVGLRRPTRDIDLQAETGNAVEHLEQLIREICTQPVEPDGMRFDPATVAGDRIMNQADLQGVRVKLRAYLGSIALPLQIDIGFANVITPPDLQLQPYPTLLGAPEPQLKVYPPETVVAEKLQALVFLGEGNDRLKDFFDLWLLAQQTAFEGSVLTAAVRATFHHRQTVIPRAVPTGLTAGFAAAKQAQWRAFLNRAGITDSTPGDFAAVIDALRAFLLPVLRAAAGEAPFTANWQPSQGWQP